MSRYCSTPIWALLGQVAHGVFERAAESAEAKGSLAERRLFMELVADGQARTISGQVDLFALDRTINDYKLTSTWTRIFGGRDEWEHQLNGYAMLARANGLNPQALRIIAIYRDYSATRLREVPDYPRTPIESIEIPLWPDELTRAFFINRLEAHLAAEAGNLPDCTPEERWHRGEAWAVEKSGRKRALRLLSSQDEAEDWAAAQNDNDKLTITHRPGRSVRCESYCEARHVCDQWRRLQRPNDFAWEEAA